MAETKQENNRQADLELVSVRDLYDGGERTNPIHAEVTMNAKRNFTAGDISVKGFAFIERNGAILSHEVFYDESLAAIPRGRVVIHLLGDQLTYNQLPWREIQGPSEVHFVFYQNGFEIIRYQGRVTLKVQHSMLNPLRCVRKWWEEKTILYTAYQ